MADGDSDDTEYPDMDTMTRLSRARARFEEDYDYAFEYSIILGTLPRTPTSIAQYSPTRSPAPFTTVAAPKAAFTGPFGLDTHRQFTDFTRFPKLPTELRHKIWKLAIPDPQIIYVNYDTTILTPKPRYFNPEPRGTWKVTNGMTSLAIMQVCQEARAESPKVLPTYTRLRLPGNKNEIFLINFEIDTIFLNTNAFEWNSEEDRVAPPKHPLCGRQCGDFDDIFEDNLRFLVIGDSLWDIWAFAEDWGTDVSCECCPGYGMDETHDEFRSWVYRWATNENAQSLQIVDDSIFIWSDDVEELPPMRFKDLQDSDSHLGVPVATKRAYIFDRIEDAGGARNELDFKIVRPDDPLSDDSDSDGDSSDDESDDGSSEEDIEASGYESEELSDDELQELASRQLLAELQASIPK